MVDMTIQQDIINLKEEYAAKVTARLKEEYPYLLPLVCQDGNLHLWVRDLEHNVSGAAITPELKPWKYMTSHDFEVLEALNDKVRLAATQPDKYFYCTECQQVKPIEEYEDFVMAAYYCKDCAKKPEIKYMIDLSKEAGFYD